MKHKICVFAIMVALSAGFLFATPDSLDCRMVDYLHVRASEFFDRPASWDYSFSGNLKWDLAMGDSILVWLPGENRKILIFDAYDSTALDTILDYPFLPFTATDPVGVDIKDSLLFIVGGGGVIAYHYEIDSLRYIDGVGHAGADYHYAVIEDTFLYTYIEPGLECINIANPESIFVARTYSDSGASSLLCETGFEVLDGYVYSNHNAGNYDTVDYEWHVRIKRTDMTNSQEPLPAGSYRWDNFQYGDLTTDGEFVYFAITEINPFHPWPYWYHYSSYLHIMHHPGVYYTFDSRWDSAGVFGLEIIDSDLIAAGFKHGFSILNICNLDSIEEVAYYFDPDSELNFTHFAMKDNRLYAMGHPSEYWARLYLFILGDSVVSAISDPFPQTSLPEAIAISAWPNPFNGNCRLQIDDCGMGIDAIEIFDINGRMVAEIIPPGPPFTRGEEEGKSLLSKGDLGGLVWTPDAALGSGVYLVRATVGDESITKTTRIILLK